MSHTNFANETNPHVAKKIQDIMDEAELKYRLKDTPHAETYRFHANRSQGLTKRLLKRMIELGATQATDMFYQQVGI